MDVNIQQSEVSNFWLSILFRANKVYKSVSSHLILVKCLMFRWSKSWEALLKGVHSSSLDLGDTLEKRHLTCLRRSILKIKPCECSKDCVWHSNLQTKIYSILNSYPNHYSCRYSTFSKFSFISNNFFKAQQKKIKTKQKVSHNLSSYFIQIYVDFSSVWLHNMSLSGSILHIL